MRIAVDDVAITNKFERNWNNDKTFDLDLLKVFCGTSINLLNDVEKKIDFLLLIAALCNIIYYFVPMVKKLLILKGVMKNEKVKSKSE